MNPITNSKIREQFRKNNENIAKAEESSINQKLQQDIAVLKKKDKPSISPHISWGFGGGIAVGIVAGIVNHSFALFGKTWIGIFAFSIVIWACRCAYVKSYNESIDEKIAALKRTATAAIKKAYDEADRKTRLQIERYDKEVASYFKKIKNNKVNLDRMRDFTCAVFENYLADAVGYASNMERFVAFDFLYTVTIADIIYTSNVAKTTPFLFDYKSERYRNLDKDTECEALAAVLAKLITGYLKKKYGASQVKVRCSNNDASVTLHFEMPNRNFVPATVIV